jgi:hypothetical protein
MDSTRQKLIAEAERLLKEVNDHLATAAESAVQRPKRPFDADAFKMGPTDEPSEVSDFETPWQTRARELKQKIESFFARLPPDAHGKARDSMLNVWPCPPEVLTAWRDELVAVRAWALSPP